MDAKICPNCSYCNDAEVSESAPCARCNYKGIHATDAEKTDNPVVVTQEVVRAGVPQPSPQIQAAPDEGEAGAAV